VATFNDAHALVVGVASYHHPSIAALPQAVRNDASDIAALLADPQRCGYDPNRIRRLTDAEATRDAILGALGHLAKGAGVREASTVCLFFSCHGAQAGARDFLLPVDTDASSQERLAQTAISASELTDRVNNIPAGKLLVVLDCCHAAGLAAFKGVGAPAVETGLTGDMYERLKAGRGRAVLAACALTERAAIIPPDARNSLFTTHLLDGLRGKATEKDDDIKLFGLFEYVQMHVTLRNQAQHPVFKADVENNFAVALNNAREKGVVARPPADSHRYDVFVAHAEEDVDWVFDNLVPRFDQEGLRYTVSARALGSYRVVAIEQAVQRSKYVLVIISPHYTADRFAQLGGILAQDQGVREGMAQLIPVKIGEPTEALRLGIQALVGVDLTGSEQRQTRAFESLIETLHRAPEKW